MSLYVELVRRVRELEDKGQKPTQIHMSEKTRGHLTDELRRVESVWKMDDKKALHPDPPPRQDIVPVSLFGIRIVTMENIPDDYYFFTFWPLKEVVDPRTGKIDYVAESQGG